MSSVSPDPTPEELRAQAERDGMEAHAEVVNREETQWALHVGSQEAATGYVRARASLMAAMALLFVVIALSIPAVLIYLAAT